MARDATTVDVGGDHHFWDVFPSDKVYRKAGVKREGMSSISVMVEEDGEISLNNGYEPGSEPHSAETSLFDLASRDVERLLVEEISRRFPEEPRYAGFMERHQPSSGPRI